MREKYLQLVFQWPVRTFIFLLRARKAVSKTCVQFGSVFEVKFLPADPRRQRAGRTVEIIPTLRKLQEGKLASRACHLVFSAKGDRPSR